MIMNLSLVENGIFFITGIAVFMFNIREIDLSKISSHMYLFIKIAIAVECVQVALFLLTERLPALAWKIGEA
jgi:hypothetical protein